MVPDNTIPTPTRGVGSASIVAKFLGVDLTKCMLVEPTGLIDIDSNGSVPRLLVDTSGDCAIAINPSSQFEAISVRHGGNSETKKTSNLVQFLAPRPARLFDVDVPTSFRLFCSLSLAPSRSIVGGSHGLDPVVDLKVLF